MKHPTFISLIDLNDYDQIVSTSRKIWEVAKGQTRYNRAPFYEISELTSFTAKRFAPSSKADIIEAIERDVYHAFNKAQAALKLTVGPSVLFIPMDINAMVRMLSPDVGGDEIAMTTVTALIRFGFGKIKLSYMGIEGWPNGRALTNFHSAIDGVIDDSSDAITMIARGFGQEAIRRAWPCEAAAGSQENAAAKPKPSGMLFRGPRFDDDDY